MQKLKFVYWQDGNAFLGYLVDYPDYWTQGESFDDLKAHLLDLYRDIEGGEDIESGEIPGIRDARNLAALKVDELVVP